MDGQTPNTYAITNVQKGDMDINLDPYQDILFV